MIDHDELIKVAQQYRNDTIEARIARLEAMVAQTNASELYQRADHLERKLMSPMETLALAGIPDAFVVQMGGDGELIVELIAELQKMRSDPSEPEFTIQIDAEALRKGLVAAVKNIKAVGTKELVIGKEHELLENPDMSPWASSIE